MERHHLAAAIFLSVLLVGACLHRSPAVQPGTRPSRPLGAGIRYSTYGPKYDPGPAYWARTGREMASHFPGAQPEAIWIVGRLHGSGVRLSFPVKDTSDPLIEGAAEDESEAALKLFDRYGFRVWLQVEPGYASVEKQIHLMLRQYGHHRSVQGVGVDVEWNKSTNPDGGEPVSDAEAASWLKAARTYNRNYRLFLKHFKPDVMPPTIREGLVFIDDSQIFQSFDAMVEEFTAWGKRFAPAPVSFQFGYPSDRPWWSNLKDPPAEIGRRILDAVPNTEALIWVDFTVLEVFPPDTTSTTERITAIKIYEHKGDMRQLFDRFAELGINTVFASETLCANADFWQQASKRKIKVFLIVPIFFDSEALKLDPDLYAITSKGERAKEDWVEFVCPTREEFRQRKITALRDAVVRLQPDGVSLDFVRYFAYWEMVRPDRNPDTLPDTCYCPHCLARFSADTGITLPPDITAAPQAAEWISRNQEERWIGWKANVITSMVQNLEAAARQAKPGIRVNLHAVPWRSDDFGGAIHKVVAQDFKALSQVTDFVSPMCYSLMLHRDASWIHSVVQDIGAVSSCPVLPSIQVRPHYPGDNAMSTADFEEAVKAAIAPPSLGVILWSWEQLVQDQEKMAVLKKLAAR